MRYVLTFSGSTTYNVHAQGCTAAKTTRGGLGKVLLPETFDSIEAARAWANADESEKAGEKTEALFTVCKCAKSVTAKP